MRFSRDFPRLLSHGFESAFLLPDMKRIFSREIYLTVGTERCNFACCLVSELFAWNFAVVRVKPLSLFSVEYVQKYVEYLLNGAIYRQFEAFYHGFHSVCASNALIVSLHCALLLFTVALFVQYLTSLCRPSSGRTDARPLHRPCSTYY